jgi:predicted dehydrogenase
MTSRQTAPLGLGIVGAGDILPQYLATFAASDEVEVRFLAGVDRAQVAAKAREHGIPGHGTLDDLLADASVDLVVNLTPPQAHHAISRAALAAGRHVWSEKPLSVDDDEARELLDLADAQGVRLGCAPDTFLGPGLQTALRLLAEGRIGEPRSAHARFQYAGPDFWHPNPAFFFARGGGPLLDVGPYYLTALVQALGPIVRVTAVSDRARSTRRVLAGPRAGQPIPVEVPTHVLALYTFASGAVADLSASFDAPVITTEIEITGTEGALRLPDPNMFDGDTVVHARTIDGSTETVPADPRTGGPGRGSGIVDLARAVAAGEPHRADARLAYHVLDVMLSTLRAAETGQPVDVTSTCTPAPLLPAGWTL